MMVDVVVQFAESEIEALMMQPELRTDLEDRLALRAIRAIKCAVDEKKKKPIS